MSPKAKNIKKPAAHKAKSRAKSAPKTTKTKELDDKDLSQISGGLATNRIKIW